MSKRSPRDAGRSGADWLARALGILFLLWLANQASAMYVEHLWFDSLGYASVYWTRLSLQVGSFLVLGAGTVVLMSFLLRQALPGPAESRSVIEFGGETIIVPSLDALRRMMTGVAVLLGLLSGLAYGLDWTRYGLLLNRPAESFGTDPVLGQELGFYLFVAPALESLSIWFLILCVLGLIVASIGAVLDRTQRFRGLSVTFAFFLIALAAYTYLYRYRLFHEENALFTGVSYVDAHARLPGLWAIVAALLLGASICVYGARTARTRNTAVRNLAIAAAIPAVTYAAAWVVYPAYLVRFYVQPNELALETPYIADAIDGTRQAYGLDDVEVVSLDPLTPQTPLNPAEHAETLENIRLWDWRALQSTLEQIQEIRTYYDFADVDVDRYEIDGRRRSMMVAARELNLNRVAGAPSWVRDRLVYTHGYGVTMNSVNRFTPGGLPDLILRDMPVASTVPSLRVTRPEIYFGELTNWPVYVKTKQPEHNYPEGDRNNTSRFEGSGGIPVGGFFRRLMLAYQTGELTELLFSDDVGPESELLMRRNIRERVATLAPFLVYDDDAYIVVAPDGALYWILDAYTVSDQYPYSEQIRLGTTRINYIRNSVKVVVNAYDGTTRFYVFDDTDPVIEAYSRMFPGLFLPGDSMPDGLRPHVRYGELLFRIQAAVYVTYHVEDPQVFFSREDLWTVAQQGRSQTESNEIEPYFVMLRFPGETQAEFVSILPFTPAERNNLIGWMAGRSDGEHYGKLRAYHFPKTRFVDGPLQIEARIDQDPELSSQLSLWNQQGSTVLRGNLLVIPLDETLLFVAPIYLQAERSPMPELRIVVLATQDGMAYGSSFDEALARLLGREAPPIDGSAAAGAVSGGGTSIPGAGGAAAGVDDVVRSANEAFADYQRLTAEGRLTEAGRRLEDLQEALRTLERLTSP